MEMSAWPIGNRRRTVRTGEHVDLVGRRPAQAWPFQFPINTRGQAELLAITGGFAAYDLLPIRVGELLAIVSLDDVFGHGDGGPIAMLFAGPIAARHA